MGHLLSFGVEVGPGCRLAHSVLTVEQLRRHQWLQRWPSTHFVTEGGDTDLREALAEALEGEEADEAQVAAPAVAASTVANLTRATLSRPFIL